IFASLIPDTKTKFPNVPITLLDYKGAKEILEHVGAKVIEKDEEVTIDTAAISIETLEVCGEVTSKSGWSWLLGGSLRK
ncbi:UDP-N-acetylglucosamine 1-carboxyvinyltransferase, partial [Francisella tularensis subsp. holarctica]|nr:UDP-N-acetylglucosamine 1-carboxyvinyltransferase [Francisella tularensis subsp. holarctica]